MKIVKNHDFAGPKEFMDLGYMPFDESALSPTPKHNAKKTK